MTLNDVLWFVGAINAEWGQSGVTHLVISDNEVDPTHIPHTSTRVQVVKQQWFWESIKIDACADEQLYQAKVYSLQRFKIACIPSIHPFSGPFAFFLP